MKKGLLSIFMVAALLLTFVVSPLSVATAADSGIYASDVHKNNVGKILFSESNIVAGKETASQFTTDFTADSNIYAIAYLDKKVQSIEKIGEFYDDTYISYETVQAVAAISVDGERFYTNSPIFVPVNIQDYNANKAYITFEIIPNPKNTVGYSQIAWYEDLLLVLESGQHNISISLLLGKNDTEIAAGEFEIDWTNADLDKIKKNADDCNKIAAEARAKSRKVPAQFSQKHKPYKDALLSDKNIKALIMEGYENCKKITKFITVGKSPNQWYTVKDEDDYPKARYSANDTWAIFEGKDGWSYIIEVKVKCDYEGFGVYGEPYIDPVIYICKIATKNVK